MAEVERFHLASGAAQEYEQRSVPTVMQPHTDAIFEHVSLHEGERVLDVACGTGIVTRIAVARFPHIACIVGVDLNPHMLDIARASTPTTSIPVAWQEGDMCALPLPDHSFDVVVCQQGLQYVPDKVAALRDIKRVLVSDGRLIVTIWKTPHLHNAVLADAFRHHVNDEVATRLLAPFAWGHADTIRQAVDNAGFGAIEMEVIESISRLSSSTEAVRSYVEGMAARYLSAGEIAKVRMALEEEVSAALQTYRVGDEFVMSSQAHLVQARSA